MVIEVELAVEPRLHVIADRYDADRVPLAEFRDRWEAVAH